MVGDLGDEGEELEEEEGSVSKNLKLVAKEFKIIIYR